jgi:hypothetical protein
MVGITTLSYDQHFQISGMSTTCFIYDSPCFHTTIADSWDYLGHAWAVDFCYSCWNWPVAACSWTALHGCQLVNTCTIFWLSYLADQTFDDLELFLKGLFPFWQ